MLECVRPPLSEVLAEELQGSQNAAAERRRQVVDYILRLCVFEAVVPRAAQQTFIDSTRCSARGGGEDDLGSIEERVGRGG